MGDTLTGCFICDCHELRDCGKSQLPPSRGTQCLFWTQVLPYSLQCKLARTFEPENFPMAVCVDALQFSKIPSLKPNPIAKESGQVRYGAYAETARRRDRLATVLLRPPSGHRPGRRQARHARILLIGLHLTQP